MLWLYCLTVLIFKSIIFSNKSVRTILKRCIYDHRINLFLLSIYFNLSFDIGNACIVLIVTLYVSVASPFMIKFFSVRLTHSHDFCCYRNTVSQRKIKMVYKKTHS